MKKIISLLLTALMLFTMAVPAFAADGEEAAAKDYNGYPVIIVRGIDFAGLTYEDGSNALLSMSYVEIFGVLLDAVLTRFALKDEEALADGIFELAESILSPIAGDNEGNSADPEVSMVQYPESMAAYPEFTSSLQGATEVGMVKSAVERYGAENTYYFTYDWRKTPAELASELNALVETAKADSGMDKVNISCVSMGGMVTTAYFYYYGTDSVNTAVFLSGAQNGTYVAGDALNGRIVFDTDTIINLVNSLTDSNILVEILLRVFDALGAFDYITDFLNDFVSENFQKANDMVLRDCMGTLPGFWALCPDEDFESGIETIFGGHEDEYPVLLGKINDMKDFVFSTEETLQAAEKNGVKISFVSNYNTGLVPVYEKSNRNGDMVLETELTSNFATVAPLGETLSDEQLAGADPKYVSADKVINASTALFKDYTWFVKNAPHVASEYGSQFSEFAFWLLDCEEQLSVYTNEKYPQFMVADDNLALSPLK
ncbi:MAG: hypothetical protein IJ491_07215 [Clostridia bacterium]|nr:hypothetical protein [Clostridia bacterium]